MHLICHIFAVSDSKKEITKAHQNFVELYNTGDVTNIVNLFCDDYTLYINGHQLFTKNTYPDAFNHFMKNNRNHRLDMQIIDTECSGMVTDFIQYFFFS